MLECGVMADCSNDRDAVVTLRYMGKCLSMPGIREIPTSWLPLQIIVGALFVHDMIVKPLAKDAILQVAVRTLRYTRYWLTLE